MSRIVAPFDRMKLCTVSLVWLLLLSASAIPYIWPMPGRLPCSAFTFCSSSTHVFGGFNPCFS